MVALEIYSRCGLEDDRRTFGMEPGGKIGVGIPGVELQGVPLRPWAASGPEQEGKKD
jgi:hypothetical protein